MHSVACPATRPSWSGTSGSRWFHAIGIQLLHVLQLRRTIEVKHIGKSMVPCHRSPLRCMFCNLAAWSGTLESRWLHFTCIQPVAFSSLGLTIVVRHIGKSMVLCHRHATSLHVLQLGLTAWSGTSERQWLHAIGIHNVALLATRPSWSGTSESRWSHAIDIHTVACPATRLSWSGTSESRWSHASASTPLHVLQLGLTVVGRHIGKSMVPLPSAYTSLHVLQLGLTVGVRHIGKSMDLCYGIYIVVCSATRPDRRGQAHGKPMVPCHRHPHRCLSCTKGV